MNAIVIMVTLFGSLGGMAVLYILYVYMKSRKKGFEDRYMEQYGREDWSSSNMYLDLIFSVEEDAAIKALFLQRLEALLKEKEPSQSLYHETVQLKERELTFGVADSVSVEECLQPRMGIYFELQEVGKIKVVWSHIQADGLRMWREVRPLFDPNPHILPFAGFKAPIPLLPEVLSLPVTLKSMLHTGHLKPDAGASLEKHCKIWSTQPIKHIKNQLKGSFNLVTASMLLEGIFERHPDTKALTVGLTVAFTHLQAKNKYGVFTMKVKRGTFQSIYRQLNRQIKRPLFLWGNFSNQSLMLSLLPDALFTKVLDVFRGRIDVLISNLPVGKFDVEMNESPVKIGCHTDVLSIPYYFLLLGTKSHLHLSCTSKFAHDEHFWEQERFLVRLRQHQVLPEIRFEPVASTDG